MCLARIAVTCLPEGDGTFIGTGFKFFAKTEYPDIIKNWRSENIEYEYNRWYEADIHGDRRVQKLPEHMLINPVGYTSGFHIFLSLSDAHRYSPIFYCDANYLKLQVQFKNILSIGYEPEEAERNGTILIIVAQYMKILPPQS